MAQSTEPAVKSSDGEQVEPLGAEAVGRPAGQRDDAGQGQRVAGHGPGDLGRGGVELALEGLERDGDDGDVEDGHDRAEDDDARDHQDVLVELVGVVRLVLAGLSLGVVVTREGYGCHRQPPNPFGCALRSPSRGGWSPSRSSIRARLGPRRCWISRAPDSTSRITRRMLRQVSRARSSSDQPRSAERVEQRRVGRDVLEPGGQHLDAVVVTAEPDVVDPGHLAHVLAVRHHVGQVGGGLRGGRSRTRRRRREPGVVGLRDPLAAAASTTMPRCQSAQAAFTNLGTKVTMQIPPPRAQRLEHVVGGVAGAVGHRPGRAVAEDRRHLGHGEGVAHRVGRDVGEVDHHADPVHLRGRPRGRRR